MNKKVKYLYVLITAFCCFTIGCNDKNTNDVIVTGDMLKYNRIGSKDFGFNLNLIDNKPDTTVEFLECTGKNTDGLTMEYNDDTFEDIKNKKLAGRYLTILGFVCHTENDYVEIDSITLNINNKKTVVQLSTPLIHTLKKASSDDSVYSTVYPSMICTNSFSNTDYPFGFHAEKNAELVSFEFNDFVVPQDSTVLVNQIPVGSLDDVFPLSVKSGDDIEIQCKIDFKPDSKNSKYTNVVFNSELTYHAENLSENSVISNDIFSQAVSNVEDAEALILELK